MIAEDHLARFLYLYFMKDDSRVGAVAPAHASYWQALQLNEYLGGPFADYSGGLIIFCAASPKAAAELVGGDPFIEHDLLDRHYLKEWVIDEPGAAIGNLQRSRQS